MPYPSSPRRVATTSYRYCFIGTNASFLPARLSPWYIPSYMPSGRAIFVSDAYKSVTPSSANSSSPQRDGFVGGGVLAKTKYSIGNVGLLDVSLHVIPPLRLLDMYAHTPLAGA